MITFYHMDDKRHPDSEAFGPSQAKRCNLTHTLLEVDCPTDVIVKHSLPDLAKAEMTISLRVSLSLEYQLVWSGKSLWHRGFDRIQVAMS